MSEQRGDAAEAPETKRPAGWRAYSGRSLPANVRALSLVSFLQDVASEMVYPLLPGFLALLGGGAVALGAMESAAEGVLALVKGWAGRASDRAGKRKPFVTWGYGLSAAARPLLAIAALPWHVVALRTADRFAKGLRTAPRDALIADSTPAEQRGFAFSFHRGLDHLGAAVGPLLAAGVLAIWEGQLRLVFALATVPAVLGVGVVLWRVRETGIAGRREEARRGAPPAGGYPVRARRGRLRATGSPPPGAPHVVASTSDEATAAGNAEASVGVQSAGDGKGFGLPRALRLPLAAVFLFGLGNASDAFLLLRGSQLGLDALGLTLLWSGFHIVKWACSAPSGRLVDRLGPGKPLLLGWVLYAAVYAGFAYASGIAALLALLVFYAVYYGLTEGAERTLVTALAGESGRGTALGAYHLASGAGLFLASLLFGVIWERVTPRAAFLVGGALALAAAALLAAALSSNAAASRKPAS